jgi:mono/diheme cytochrome c family protein
MRLLISFASVALLATAGLWALSAPRPAVANDDVFFASAGDSARGKLIFDAADCASCHATPTASADATDPTRLGGGLVLKTAFGTFHVPNISSDRKDGIGAWTAAQIANALLSGVGRNGENLYPVLPYTSYSRMTRADVRDLIAYLRTLPPVSGKPPPHEISFPFSIRRAIGLWKALYFRPGPVAREPGRSASWNRGHYLVDAVAHCAECHSPRNIFGAVIPAQRFAGGPDPTGDGWVPNITPGPHGIAGWSVDDVAEVLTDGITPDYDDVGSSMAEVVRNTSKLPKSDVAAIAEFIKSLPPRSGPPEPPSDSKD